MKKTMLFSSALVALAMLASCQKEEFIETPAIATGVTEFTATIESTSTKTTIASDGKVTWTAGDEITVTDAESNSAVYVAASSETPTTFTLKQGQTAVGSGPYTATYGDITKQKYSATGANCPLSAKKTATGSKTLQFSSPYAVLKITAQSSNAEVIKTVAVTYGNNSYYLDCSEKNVALTSTGVDFYVAIEPANAAELSVAFYNTADKMAKKTRNESISLKAKDLLPVKFDLSSSTWTTPTTTNTFKAVYKGDDGSLTFYYDNNLHVGEGVLYDNLCYNAAKAADWGYNGVRSKIEKVAITESVKNYSSLTSTAYMFQGMKAATSISGAEHLNVSNVTNMSQMFCQYGYDSKSLADVPNVSNWNTEKVENMSYLFCQYGYYESTSSTQVPDVSNWNTEKVENMSCMFSGYGYYSTTLTQVPTVNGSNWNTEKVKDMSSMFLSFGYKSSSLAVAPKVENWETGEVTNMSGMFQFYGYSSTSLNDVPKVGSWNTGQVTNMSNMFYGFASTSTALTEVPEVNGSNWDTSKVENMSQMFRCYGYSSSSLKKAPAVDGDGWETTSLTKMGYMFEHYGNGSVDFVLDLSGWDLSKITSNSGYDFDLNPNTFKVTIPAKTDGKSNDTGNWYYGQGGNKGSIIPPTNKEFEFTLATN